MYSTPAGTFGEDGPFWNVAEQAPFVTGPDEPYRELFGRLHAGRMTYLRSWTHDVPLVVSPVRDAELGRVQQLLVRFARHYDSCYERFLDVVGYDERVLRILGWASERPHVLSTFRPDYLICADGSVRVCEITSRFFGNGYFYSFFMDNTARELAEGAGMDDGVSRIEEMLAAFARMAKGKRRLVVLKSADRSDSIPLYVPFYEALGLEVEVRDAARAHGFAADDHTLLLSALNQRDLLSLSDDDIRRFVDAGGRNDLRTMFLLHDKRVLALAFDDEFCAGCFSAEETAFLRAHVVRTSLRGRDEEVWEDARAHRERYILKHARLGKSEKVYAGALCTHEEWAALFESPEIEDMILQPFEDQRRFAAHWQGQDVEEYICGTMLCLDDDYYGPGFFRASLLPVVNVRDNSKVAPLVSAQAERLERRYVM